MSDDILFYEHANKPMPLNYKGNVSAIRRQYETDAPSIPHAFQKDVIQNAVGARPSNSWIGWRCEIKVVEAKPFSGPCRVVVISDYGTTGLRGNNYSNEEIIEKSNNQFLSNHPEENLGRISSVSNSGGNKMGGGLFGVGKTLYSIASNENTCTYYFESVSAEGYRASRNQCGLLPDKAYEGDEAKKWWRQYVGLVPREDVGTTFVIVDPTDEIVSAIESGEMLQDVEETWWRIIPKCSGENEGIFVNGQKASIPLQYRSDFPGSQFADDHDKPIYADQDNQYRITKYGFHLVSEELPENLQGFSYYRKGMKICKIDIDRVPDKYRKRFYGYVEVDESWEEELKRLESETHYRMAKRQTKTFSVLRNFAQQACEDWLAEHGLARSKESEDRRLRRLLDDASEAVQDFYSGKKYDPLGQGETRRKLVVNWKGVVYPNPDEERTVHTNDIFVYGFEIINGYLVEKDVFVTLTIENSQGSSDLLCEKIKVTPWNNAEFFNRKLQITPSVLEPNEVNYLVLKVRTGAVTVVKKKLLYYDIPTEKDPQKDFEISVERTFPRPGRRRVNPGESVKDIVANITNNMQKPVTMRLLLSTFDATTNQHIEDVFEKTVVIPADTMLEVDCPPIVFKQDVYDDSVGKGKVEVRSRITVAEDANPYPKGFKAGKYSFIVFYNTSDKNGAENAFKAVPVSNPERHETSWIDGGPGNWQISVNIGHPEYKTIQDDDSALTYFKKEANRQFAYIYIKSSNYSIIGLTEEQMADIDPAVLISKLEETIQENWWAICQR